MGNRKAWAWCGVCLLCAVSLAACSGRPTGMEEFQAGDETPPETAGSLEALVGTTWELGHGQTLTFQENGQGIAARPNSVPMNMTYELRDDGVISVMLIGASRSGTWDGTTLIIGGEEARQVQTEADSMPAQPDMAPPD